MMAKPSPSRRVTHDAIDTVTTLSRDQLIDRWTKTYKRQPPKGISRTLLERSAAYQAQAKLYGGLNVTTRRALRAMLTVGKTCRPAKSAGDAKPRLEPGMRLVRAWNGCTYSVDVIEGGFVWDGHMHKSLSVIARKITGARWSGPRFFGL
jgi:hypothetical protein